MAEDHVLNSNSRLCGGEKVLETLMILEDGEEEEKRLIFMYVIVITITRHNLCRLCF